MTQIDMPPWTRKAGLLALAMLAGAPWLSKVAVLARRGFDPDEFQHLHSSWCLASGSVPYRDYFEHHTPALYFFLSPFIAYLHPESSAENAWRTVLFSRGLMWGWTGLTLVFVAWFGRLWKSWTVGLLAVCFLSSLGFFWDKALEIRPDVPAAALLMAGLLLAFQGVERSAASAGNRSARWSCLAAGVCSASAMLLTQKAIFAVCGVLAFWAYFIADGASASPRSGGSRAALVGCWAIGATLPFLATLAWFWSKGGLSAFIYFTYTLNTQVTVRFSPVKDLKTLLIGDPFLAMGLLWMSLRLLAARRANSRDALLVACGWAAFGGLFVVQLPWLQAYLPLLPLLALAAAELVISFVGRLGPLKPLVVGGVAATLAWQSGLTPQPATNQHQERMLRWVMNNASEAESVLGDWPSYGVFRPHPWFYWTLNASMTPMIPKQDREAYAQDFISGRVRPKLLTFRALEAISPGLSNPPPPATTPVLATIGCATSPDRGSRLEGVAQLQQKLPRQAGQRRMAALVSLREAPSLVEVDEKHRHRPCRHQGPRPPRPLPRGPPAPLIHGRERFDHAFDLLFADTVTEVIGDRLYQSTLRHFRHVRAPGVGNPDALPTQTRFSTRRPKALSRQLQHPHVLEDLDCPDVPADHRDALVAGLLLDDEDRLRYAPPRRSRRA